MKVNYLLVISLVFTLLISSIAQATTDSEIKILVMGDSLSAGYGIEVDQGWVELSRIQLKQSHPEVTLINASISGETAKGGSRRLPLMIKVHQPDMLILELGANDGLRGYPVNSITLELKKMIEYALEQNIEVVLVGIQLPPNLGDTYNNAFSNQYPDLAKQYDLALVPFLLEGVVFNDKWMQNDGLHPNALGQPTLRDNVLEILLPILDGKLN
ncbi:arylesterase [Marinicellulosiphila megalodicopiae]|uniref:arylesterase n=1 Tax=Marinicellulosiphila megalodicopiae TaxID=2724896 RepID=UPI003BB0B25E